MKKFLISLFVVGLVIYSCPTVGSLLSEAWVDDSYPESNEDTDGDAYFTTIGSALAAVQSGGTVHVAAGVYSGPVTFSRSNVTLRSIEGSAATVIDFRGVWCGYWSTGNGGVDIPDNVTGVTIQGFTILGSSPASDALISIGGSNNTVCNNIVIGDPLSGGQDIGIHIGNVAETAQLPSDNQIFKNEVYDHAGSGIFVGNWAGTNNCISENTVHHNVVGGIPGLNGNGIEIDRALHVVITANEVYENEAAGIKVVRTAPDAEVEITCNAIFINDTGVLSEQWRPGAAGSASVTMMYNNVEDNRIGVQNTVQATINCTYNWWGDATGPYHVGLNPLGTGDTVSDNVVFFPWGSIPYRCAIPGIPESTSPLGSTQEHICPLADYNIRKAENLLASVQKSLGEAESVGDETSEAEELLIEALALLEKAKIFCRHTQNCVAGNTLAIEAQALLERVMNLLES